MCLLTLFTLAACYVCVLIICVVHFGCLLCLCAYTLGCLLLFEDAAVYFKKHCTNKHKRNLPFHVTIVNTNTGALPLQTNARGRQHEAQIPTNSRANTSLTNTPHNTFLKLERLSVPAIYTYLVPSSKKSCGHAPAYCQHTVSFAIFVHGFIKSTTT